MKIAPARILRGEIELPGDKSISHRAAMFSALAGGTARIRNYSASADCGSTLSCLETLGVPINRDGLTVTMTGVGKQGFRAPSGTLDCGNSGTTMRLMAGILAGQGFETTLTGDGSLRKRPMKRIIEPLALMGAHIGSDEGRAPLAIRGTYPLQPVSYTPPVASAQLKSCVLLAGLFAAGKTSVTEPTPTRDHTERMLRFLGAILEHESNPDGDKLTVSGDSKLTARDMLIPGDISAAAFFIVAAACLESSEIVLKNVGLNPSRTAVLDALKGFGAEIRVLSQREECNEPVGDLVVRGGSDKQPGGPNVLRGAVIANLIDEIPILAIFGTQMQGGLEVRDASELRVKESDRIAAVVENLKRMGASVIEYPDGFRVERSDLTGARIDSFDDHRIAMAFAVAGLLAEGETEIVGAECAAVSFPAFFKVLEGAVQR